MSLLSTRGSKQNQRFGTEPKRACLWLCFRICGLHATPSPRRSSALSCTKSLPFTAPEHLLPGEAGTRTSPALQGHGHLEGPGCPCWQVLAPRETRAGPELLVADEEKRGVLALGLDCQRLSGGAVAGSWGFPPGSVDLGLPAFAGLRQRTCQ